MAKASLPAENTMTRRTFLDRSATAVVGAALLGDAKSAGAASLTASSYERVIGANDRIQLGHVGIGNRGRGLEYILSQLKDSKNVEVVRLCDLWKVNLEHAVAKSNEIYGRTPHSSQIFEDVLNDKELDAVIISTPEHQHSPMLKMVAEAGKHAYVEKPMGNVLEEAKAARDAVLERKLIVQVGTQRRSEPYQIAANKLVSLRSLRRSQQSRSRVELSRSSLARPPRSKTNPRSRHRLAPMADDQALSAVRSSTLF